MSAAIAFTGERFVPGAIGEIAHEHWHRYAFARRFLAGRRVLDAACGEGYGSALMATVAAVVTGIDIDPDTVAHARAAYASRANVRYEVGAVTALPFADGAFDAVVSFETIEHLAAEDQPRMLAEFARVLAPGGLLVLSSPTKRRYSDERGYCNPYHRHELYRDELARILAPAFPRQSWFQQQLLYASAIWRDAAGGDATVPGEDTCETLAGGQDRVDPAAAIDGLYYIVVAGAPGTVLPPAGVRLSLYTDRDDSLLRGAEADAAEVLRLDALLKARDASLDRQSVHVAHLETLVAERERIVAERDAQLAAANAARESLEHALAASRLACESLEAARSDDAAATEAARRARDAAAAALAKAEVRVASIEGERRALDAAALAQERIIAYQHGMRWWLRLPLLRIERAWRQWRGQ